MVSCPHDHAPAQEIRLGPGRVEHVCLQCRGLWLPGHVVHTQIGTTAPALAIDLAPRATLRCPSDGQLLVAVMHHGIEIDICPCCHGVWLDAGERDRIVQVLQGTTERPARQVDNVDPVLQLADAGVRTFRAPLHIGLGGTGAGTAGCEASLDLDCDVDFDVDIDDGGLLEGLLGFIGEALSGL